MANKLAFMSKNRGERNLMRGARFLFLIFALCSMSLTACASRNEKPIPEMSAEEKDGLEQLVTQYAEWIGKLSPEGIQKQIDSAEHRKDAVVYNGLTNYLNAGARLGAFKSVDKIDITRTVEGYVFDISSTYEIRKLDLTLSLSEDMLTEDIYYLNQAYQASYGTDYTAGFADWTFDEMTFAPEYSMSEQMGDAGGNLLIGMGTVIVVLVFIAWIISLFKFIHQWEESRKNKKTVAAAMVDEPIPTRAEFPLPVAAASESTAPVGSGSESDEIAAVIAAAIAAYQADMGMDAGDGGKGFKKGPSLQNGLVIRSIRRR